MADTPLTVSWFDGLTKTQPQRIDTTWDALASTLITHTRRNDKGGPLWCPAVFKAGSTRRNDNVVAISCLALDFDGGVTPDELEPGWADLDYVVHSTWHHMREKRTPDGEASPPCCRWRAIFPLAGSVSATDWPQIHARLSAALAKGRAGYEGKDAARLFYPPIAPPGDVVFATRHRGELLDPAKYPDQGPVASPNQTVPVGVAVAREDEELIQRALASKSGPAIDALLQGDTSAYSGDQSRADLALCQHLAFWLGKDAQRIDRVFRQSRLMRPKWDETHFSDEPHTYGARTIQEAIKRTGECYTPPKAPKGGSGRGKAGDRPDGDAEGQQSTPVAAQLIAIGEEAELFHDERSDPYAAMYTGGVQRIMRVRGRDYRDHLQRVYYLRTDKPASRESVASALGVLAAKARFEGPQHALSVRFAWHEGKVWIDLGDARCRAICVQPSGWQVVDRPPLLFRRFSHMAALPEPVSGGRLTDLLRFINVSSEEERLLLLVWMVVALMADIATPILLLFGPQGSAKTTAARIVRALLDPSYLDALGMERNERELAQTLDHHAVPFFDNLTTIGGWQSDLLCRAVTGGGFSKRELFTDGEDVLLSFKRPIIMTGCNVPATQPDLLDRCLLIGLERITDVSRREERQVWSDFEAARPALLGALLDTLAGAMAVYPKMHLPNLPRMADFARWGAAAAVTMGYSVEEFTTALSGAVNRQTEEALESDLVGQAVVDFMAVRGSWEGTAADLLVQLTSIVGKKVSSVRDWPRQPNALSRRLTVLAPVLRGMGIEFLRGERQASARSIILRALRQSGAPSLPSSSSQPNSMAVSGMTMPVTMPPPEPSWGELPGDVLYDGPDGSDDIWTSSTPADREEFVL